MDKKYLITDFGASNGRVVVARYDGKRFSLEEVHRFDNSPVLAAGSLYWDVLRMYSELKKGIVAAVHRHGRMESLGIDSWGIDFGFIDRNGKLISNPGSYRDENRWKIAQDLYRLIPLEELYRTIGGITLPVASIYQMYHLKRTAATELTNAHKFLMITDIFNYFLTGETFNEFTGTTITLMYNQVERRWERKILDKLEIPAEIFPETLMPGTRIGNLQNEVCRELDLAPILVVAPCTHDTPGAVAGIPVVDPKRRWGFLPIGTWCVSGIETERTIVKDEGLAAGYYNEGGAEGVNLFAKNITGLWLIQQCRDKWNADEKRVISWPEIVQAAQGAPAFEAMIDVDDPVFSQPHPDMAANIREYCRATEQKTPGSRAQVARCIFESLALRFRLDFETLNRLAGVRLEDIYAVGGGTQNSFLCQLTASAVGVPVHAGPAESATVGNLLMQLKATGEIADLMEGRFLSSRSVKTAVFEPKDEAIWDEQYQKYQELRARRA